MTKIAAVAAALLAAEGAAHAQARRPSTAEQLLAESLFTEGRTLMDQGRYPEACAKLAESQRLDPGGGTLLNLGVCHEKEGKVGTAYAELDAALAQATQEGRKDRVELARARIAALTPRLPRLSVRVLAEAPDLEVKVDGVVLRKPAWGVATVVDPGAHHVEASAPGRVGFSVTLNVGEAEKRSVEVPALAPADGGGGLGLRGTAPAPASEPLPMGRTPEPSAARTAAAVAAGAGFGVAALALALWFPATVSRRASCDDTRRYCSDSGMTYLRLEQYSFWTGAIGAAVGTAGLVTFLVLPRGSSLSAAPTVGGATIDLTARF